MQAATFLNLAFLNETSEEILNDNLDDKERKRISTIPQQGITKARYRLLENQCRWLRDYINDDKKQIHKLKRNAFLNYETWRKERAIEFKKEIPQ